MSRMEARLLPLEGKYYGTEIEIDFGDGYDPEVIEIANTGNLKPSPREGQDEEDICDSHFESELTYERTHKIIRAINTFKYE